MAFKDKKKKAEYDKNYYKKNEVKRVEYQREYRKENKDKIARLKRRYNYGISEEEYIKLFKIQQGKCTICGIHQSNLTRNLAVDHNHETGKIRSLLCCRCNLILGHSLESIDILQKAIEYLKNNS